MALLPIEYYRAVIGRKIDMDGVPPGQPYQCVDLFKDFLYYQAGGPKSITLCPSTGYARDIWYDFDKLGLSKYFEKVPSNQMVDGDWTIWDFCTAAPYSHVAMFRQDNQNGTGVFLGQNQGGITSSSQINITYNGVLGGLRPKIYKETISSASNGSKSDQILHKGSKVQFNGTQVNWINKGIDCFGSKKYTGSVTQSYHWIPLKPFDRVDGNGNKTANQVVIVNNWLMNKEIYTVEEIDIPTNSARLNINGRKAWIYSSALYEVSNN